MIDDVSKRLKTIHQKNGYLFDVPDVSTGGSVRSRGVSLSQENGSVVAEINASGRTLEQLKQYIASVLGESFQITDEGKTLIIQPKETGDTDDAAA